MWNANLMQQGNFIDTLLAQHVSGTHETIAAIRFKKPAEKNN
jgi:hypothetical protein